MLKRHGVGEGEGELGPDFTSLVLPSQHKKSMITCVALTKHSYNHSHIVYLSWPTMANNIQNPPGPQPDFHLISQTHQNLAGGHQNLAGDHQTLANELGKIPNLPQFQDPNVILDQLQQINDRLGGMNTRLDGIDGRLNGIDDRLNGIDDRLNGMNDRFDGIDDRLNTMTLTLKIG